MASITKIATGYRARVRKAGITKSDCFRTKAQAVAWAASVEAEIEAGKLGKSPDKTFGQLIERYIDEVVPTKQGSRPEEIRLRRLMLDDPLAKIRLPDLTPEHFAQWRDRRLSKVSTGSVLREWNSIAAACTVAVKEWRWLVIHPMHAVKRPKQPQARTRRITDDEINRICLATGYHDGRLDTAMSRTGAALHDSFAHRF